MAEYFKTDSIELRKIMAEREIKTLKELAEKSGINRNTLTQVLNSDIVYILSHLKWGRGKAVALPRVLKNLLMLL